MRFGRIVAVAIAGVGLLAGGCTGKKEPSFGLRIRMAPALDSDRLLCVSHDTEEGGPIREADTLRLTVMSGVDDGGVFICDRVFSVGTTPGAGLAPVPAGTKVQIVVEAWKTFDAGSGPTDGGAVDAPPEADGPPGDGPADAKSDAKTDVKADVKADAKADAQTDAQTDARDAGRRRAAGGRRARRPGAANGSSPRGLGRAPRPGPGQGQPPASARGTARVQLHAEGGALAAALQRNPARRGKVILVGGLRPSILGEPNVTLELYAVGPIEIYDPGSQEFITLEDASGGAMVPRAFHSAYQLESTLPQHASILLVGGLAPKDGLEATAVALKDVGNYLDIAPTGTAAGAGILDLDLERMSFTYVSLDGPEPRFMHAASDRSSGYPLLVGGVTAGGGLRTAPGARRPGVPRPGRRPLARGGRTPRGAPSGRTVTAIGSFQGVSPAWLVVGGNLWADGADALRRTKNANVTAAGASGPPTSATSRLVEEVSLSRLEDLVPTAFHTATPLGPGPDYEAVLVAGGFVLAPAAPLPKMVATEPLGPDAGVSPLALVSRNGGDGLPEAEPILPQGFRPVGHHDAVRLTDGTVLLTGGNTSLLRLPLERGVPGAQVRPGRDADELPLRQLPGVPLPASQSGPQSRRQPQGAAVGHRSTLLKDGTVLVTGGITSRLEPGAPAPSR